MPKEQKHPKNWHQALEIITRCPICATTFEAQNARLVHRGANTNKVHLTCKKCQSYALVVISVLAHGISSVGMITDLNYNDVARLQHEDAISTDELIETYEFLKTNTLLMDRLRLTPGK